MLKQFATTTCRTKAALMAACVAVACSASEQQPVFIEAQQLLIETDLVFSGTDTPPANPTTPWLEAFFAPQGSDVLFTLNATMNLSGSENVKQYYFNFDDSLDLDALSFTLFDQSGSFNLPSVVKSENNLRAGPDGKYDIRLDFTPGGVADWTFGRNESVSYLLSYDGPGTFDFQSFNFESAPAGGRGPFSSAAHVQNTPEEGSVWVANGLAPRIVPIPEPSTMIQCVFAGAAGLLGLFHRKTRITRHFNPSTNT